MQQRRLAAELGAALTDLNLLLRRGLRPPGMNLGQARTLFHLRQQGPTRVTDLAQLERVRQPTMSALIAKMEELGWVRRATHQDDRRVVLVHLTEGGGAVLDELEASRDAILKSCLRSLSALDRAALAAALPVLHRLIDKAHRD
jgi:DNA-binding MarR family transcriptional regulator